MTLVAYQNSVTHHIVMLSIVLLSISTGLGCSAEYTYTPQVNRSLQFERGRMAHGCHSKPFGIISQIMHSICYRNLTLRLFALFLLKSSPVWQYGAYVSVLFNYSQ